MRAFRFLVPFALTLAFTVPALAAEPGHRAEAAAHGHKGKGEGKGPMQADAFRQKVGDRIQRLRGKMESRIEHGNMSAEKARELRADFERGAARVMAEVDRVGADGTVTRKEAKEVAAVAKQVRGEMKAKHGHAKKLGRVAGREWSHEGLRGDRPVRKQVRPCRRT